jgi:hydroxymethylbilane synthase
MPKPIRLGTRASPLARAQAQLVAEALIAAHGLAADTITLVPFVASGDKIQDRALAEVGGKALWTKELDQALASGQIDLAVHSMKDVETQRPPHFRLAAMLERADVRDRLIGCPRIVALKQGAVVGTSSPRRRAQLLRMRPDLQIILFRGNVATRLAKLEAGGVDATLLAAAGLERLDMPLTGTPIPLETMLPAPAQGAIGIEIRANDARLRALVAAINHRPTFDCVMAERAFLAAVGGDCRSAIAALTVYEGNLLHLRAELYSPDGAERVSGAARFAPDDIVAPHTLARDLLAQASPELRGYFAG